jgi:hypothetical protein
MAAQTVTTEEVVEAFEKFGNATKAAQYLGCTEATVRRHLRKTGSGDKPFAGGSKTGTTRETARTLPKRGVKRYLLTCAQSNTYVEGDVWDNLLALKDYYKAELMCSLFSYNRSAYEQRNGEVKPGTKGADKKEWFDPRVVPFAVDHRVEVAPGLVFCAELNILPTAKRPLSGFESYTGRKSMIVPHVKIALESVPAGNNEPAKLTYTTGTVTLKNYVQKTAGHKAEFHHCYGALLVEVTADGDWYCRQLNADNQGRIYDVGDRTDGAICAHKGKVTFGHRAEAINWGDIHEQELGHDPEVIATSWGPGGMLDILRPKFQFGHDTFSFVSQNHHDRRRAHRVFEKYVLGQDNVGEELQRLAYFLTKTAHRDWCQFVMVDSNHDRALGKWLEEVDYRDDPQNAEVFLELQRRQYQAIRERDDKFHLLEYALQQRGVEKVRFLREDESFVICRDSAGGIECGEHGHLGPNGAKGAPMVFVKMARRANRGHTHTAGIIDGQYTAGVKGRPKRFKYRKGPSSWTQSDIVTFGNGKRQIVTWWNDNWRAA